MDQPQTIDDVLSTLNPQQRLAAPHGDGPLLIVAGAGTGKTATLVHRVAWLIAQGVPPGRILLLTFTRRAAAEMLRRVDGVLQRLEGLGPAAAADRAAGAKVWGGTFHAIATRLLRRYGKAIGLAAGFTIHDRSDSEDFLNVVRTELGLAKTDRRFPKKGTCLDIYSRCVNARQKLVDVLATQLSLVQRVGRGAEAALRRLRRPQGGRLGPGLRRPAALLARPVGRSQGGRRRARSCSTGCWSTSTRTPTCSRRRSSTASRRRARG